MSDTKVIIVNVSEDEDFGFQRYSILARLEEEGMKKESKNVTPIEIAMQEMSGYLLFSYDVEQRRIVGKFINPNDKVSKELKDSFYKTCEDWGFKYYKKTKTSIVLGLETSTTMSLSTFESYITKLLNDVVDIK